MKEGLEILFVSATIVISISLAIGVAFLVKWLSLQHPIEKQKENLPKRRIKKTPTNFYEDKDNV